MSRLEYFDLSIPAPKRLAMMRADFAGHPTKYPHCPEFYKPKDWRSVRGATLQNYEGYFGTASLGFNPGPCGKNIPVLTSFDEASLPVRSIQFCDEILPRAINHNGWYADADGAQGIIRGIVAALPHGRFLSGYHWTDNGEYVLFLNEIFDSADDAARDADHEAERYAEICREDDTNYRAMANAENTVEDQESDLCEAWKTYRAAWAAYLQAPLRHAAEITRAKARVRELIVDLRVFRAELEQAREAYNG
jgi:hypothetical protein